MKEMIRTRGKHAGLERRFIGDQGNTGGAVGYFIELKCIEYKGHGAMVKPNYSKWDIISLIYML